MSFAVLLFKCFQSKRERKCWEADKQPGWLWLRISPSHQNRFCISVLSMCSVFLQERLPYWCTPATNFWSLNRSQPEAHSVSHLLSAVIAKTPFQTLFYPPPCLCLNSCSSLVPSANSFKWDFQHKHECELVAHICMCTHTYEYMHMHTSAPHLFFCLKVSVLPEMNPFHDLGPLPASDRCLAQFSQNFSLLTRTALHLKIFKDSRFK